MLLVLVQATATSASPVLTRSWFDITVALQGIFLFVIAGLIGWGQWSLRRAMVPRAEHEAFVRSTAACHDGIERRVTAVDRRIDRVEGSVEAAVREIGALAREMPTKDQYNELRVQLALSGGATKELNARLDGAKEVLATTRSLVGFINEHLIEDAKR